MEEFASYCSAEPLDTDVVTVCVVFVVEDSLDRKACQIDLEPVIENY